ncbi:winged helix-turn-helix domain-containing protein [Natronobacterium texcoconense]|uniref:DNA-binding transcriptional regulator, MarR family n=1 Tax=Natronobacterium texcoconense TaxID=1095778 RepID=A0A1H1HSN3_NATTX|nr:transcriptional regulator [Natronobacterium texcoconense]SDR28470.1 DNA-binding transcriptional regulator, MarR family [Natronobacterium texcoconense]
MEFDKLVHQPTRLQIFAYLYRHGETAFPELVEALDVTEGNLSSHLGRMEDAGAVTVEKQFVDRKPQTTYELTDEGQSKFEEHIDTLETLIDGLAGDTDEAGGQ